MNLTYHLNWKLYVGALEYLRRRIRKEGFWFCRRDPYLRWRKPVVTVHLRVDPTGELRTRFRQHVMRKDRTGGYYELWGSLGLRDEAVGYVFKLYASRDKISQEQLNEEIGRILQCVVKGKTKAQLKKHHTLWRRA